MSAHNLTASQNKGNKKCNRSRDQDPRMFPSSSTPTPSISTTSAHKPSPSEAIHAQQEDVMVHFKHILKKNFTLKDLNTCNTATLKMYRDNMKEQEHIASLKITLQMISNDENLFEYKFSSIIYSMPKQKKFRKNELTDWLADFYSLYRDTLIKT